MAGLSVKIGGDDRELQAAIRRAQSSLRRMGRDMRDGVEDAVKYSAALAGVGLAISTHLVRESLAAIDAQAKLAQSMRTTAASVATLNFAGELSGVTMEEIAAASKKLTDSLGEAQRGNGAAAQSLERLQLSASQLAALPLDQRISTINEAISELIPPTQQAAVAADLFGKNALAIMRLDSDTLAQAARDTQLFGTALSEVDSKQVEMANDAMSRLKLVGQGVVTQFTVQLAPILKMIADEMSNTAAESGNMADNIDAAFKRIASGVGFVGDIIAGVIRTFQVAADALIVVFNAPMAAIEQLMQVSIKAFELMDKIPGLDLGPQIEEMKAFGTEASGVIDQAITHMDEVLMQPLPSTIFEQFVADAQTAGQEAAQALVGPMNGATGGEGETDDGQQKRIEKLLNQYTTEQELMAEHQQAMADIELAFKEGKIASDEEFQQITRQMELDHQSKLKSVREKGLTDLQRFTQMSYKQQAQTVFGELQNMTAGIAQHNKAAFEINKVSGIANAIVNAYTGISKTLASYPYPLNIAMAAAHAASAFAQVSAIRSQQFAGGGAGSAPALAGSTPAEPVTPVTGGGAAAGGAQANQTITLEGVDPNMLYSGNMLRSLMDRLVEAQRNGARLVVA